MQTDISLAVEKEKAKLAAAVKFNNVANLILSVDTMLIFSLV